MDEMIDRVYETFRHRFDKEPEIIRSPGRINLIGEHTDYNEGFVLPAAIDKSIILGMSLNHSGRVRLYSSDLDESYEQETGSGKSDKPWANYLLGSVDQMKKTGNDLPGLDCVFGGDIPVGAGLSSSAALVGGAVFGLSHLLGLSLSRSEMAEIGRKVENEYIGVQCGIMDYFANMHGEEDSVLKLDCRSLEYELYPFAREDVGIVLCDTGTRRELAVSEYNIRREECETGVEILQQHYSQVDSLRDVTPEMLEERKDELDPVIYRRCRYVIEENDRVKESCKILENNKIEELGDLMFKSHEGLSSLYEVSCPELDALVDIARQDSGVLGARMMGGGFGGCTINLVKKNQIAAFAETVRETYRQKTGSAAEVFEVRLGGGTRQIPSC